MATLYIFGKISNDISATDSEMKLLRLSPWKRGGGGGVNWGGQSAKFQVLSKFQFSVGGMGQGG